MRRLRRTGASGVNCHGVAATGAHRSRPPLSRWRVAPSQTARQTEGCVPRAHWTMLAGGTRIPASAMDRTRGMASRSAIILIVGTSMPGAMSSRGVCLLPYPRWRGLTLAFVMWPWRRIGGRWSGSTEAANDRKCPEEDSAIPAGRHTPRIRHLSTTANAQDGRNP